MSKNSIKLISLAISIIMIINSLFSGAAVFADEIDETTDEATSSQEVTQEPKNEEELESTPVISDFDNPSQGTAADFSVFDTACEEAVDFLNSMTVPQYFAVDVNALIAIINSDEVQLYANQNEDDRAAYISGGEEEARANELAESINNQVAVVKACSGSLDLSAYKQIVYVMQNIENDAYDYAPETANADLISKTKLITSNISFGGRTIKAVNQNKSQSLIDAVVISLQSKLTTNIRKYTVEIVEGEVSDEAGVTFLNGTNTYDSSTGIFSVTYNTIMFMNADCESAWYISFDSPSVSRSIQYQGSGERYSTNVVANIKVYIYNSKNKHKVSILRKYSDNSNTPVSSETFVNSSFTLPEANAIPFYSFEGYKIDSNAYQPGEAVSITKDTVIYANYVKNEILDCAINVIGDSGISSSYNQRVNLSGDSNTYAWLELDKTNNTFKPFYIGKDVSFFATESITLKKVTQEEFEEAGFSLPLINIRQDGVFVIESDGVKKAIFNGQFVTDGVYDIAEYGIILGKAKSGGSITADDVNLENIGASEDYTLYRYKSTKMVGANQFAIGVKNLKGDVIYKGYISYKIGNNQFVTVYTDAISQTIE